MNAKEIVQYLSGFEIDLYLDQDDKLKAKAVKGAITSEIATLIKANKNDLIEYLQQFNQFSSAQTEGFNIERVSRAASVHPVSFAQQRLWFIDRLQGGSAEYNMPKAFNVNGELNLALINDVFSQIISRHEVLRTVYVEIDGEACQRIVPMSQVDFAISVEDLTELTGDAQSSAVKQKVTADMVKVFDLSNDLMLRVSYLKTAPDAGVLVFNMHHIVSDGWSMDILTKEFFALYGAFSQGLPSPLPELEIQYADYAHWQRTHLAGEVLEGQLDYWEKQLAEIPAVHGVPLSFPRPAQKQYPGALIKSRVSVDVSNKLLAMAKQFQLTPFMLMHGALSILLSRHSNRADMVIGTSVANRTQEELTPLIGFFVNTLVLRINTAQATLADYFDHVRQVHLGAQANQDVPFEQLVDRLKLSRTVNHPPLFQIIMTMNTDYGVSHDVNGTNPLQDLTLSQYQSGNLQSKFDLDVSLSVHDKGMDINWIYDVSLFSEQDVEGFSEHFCRLLTALSEIGEQGVAQVAPRDLVFLSSEQQHQLLYGLNDSQSNYPQDQCIHELIEQQAKDNPDKLAVVFEDEQISYQQLNQQANQLAHYLVEEHGVTPDTLIGVCVERSVAMVVGILGILKAGGAYVPLDASYPQGRLTHMFEDASLKLILSDWQSSMVLTEFDGQIINLDVQEIYAHHSTENIAKSTIGLTASNLAYVIYTSGSTGKPKGVLVEHGNLVNSTCARFDHYPAAVEAFFLASSISFDSSVAGLFWTLTTGAKLVLAEGEVLFDVAELCSQLREQQVNYLLCVPSMYQSLLDNADDDGRQYIQQSVHVILAGEMLYVNEYHAQQLSVHNEYGPTEASVWSTGYHLDFTSAMTGDTPSDEANPLNIGQEVPIGRAINNAQLLVLGHDQTLLPFGSTGELYIGGKGVTRGYLNQPQLTAERFIANPYYQADKPNSSPRLYRSGDLVRYLADGNLAFVGRVDDQVKIRGYRIELGEIESQLSAQQAVDSALVMAVELAGSQQLVGYVKPSNANNTASDNTANSALVAKLKSALATELPEHMIPTVLMVVEQWPLTPNGKVDRKALPAPDGNAAQGDFVAPTSATEQAMAEIWASLLDIEVEKISANADFFELGGHSLLSIRLVASIRSRFDVELSVQQVFGAKSLADLALAIDSYSGDESRAPMIAIARDQDSYTVSFAQQRLWFIDQLQGGSAEYNMPMAFNVEGELDLPLLTEVFSQIIARHEVLRTVYIEVEGEVWQRIRPMSEVDFAIKVEDLTSLDGKQQAEAVRQQVEADMVKPFDFAHDLMLRVSYLATKSDTGVLMFNIHHIASDGWSMEVLTKEFFALYEAFSQGLPSSLPELEIQYVDYAHWQRTQLTAQLAQQLQYWSKQLAEVPTLHSLPLSFPRASQKKHVGSVVRGRLSADVAKQLQLVAKQHQLTPFMLLHGAVSLLLARCSNSSDIVLGTPVANRTQQELTPLIGFFINTLVLRVNTDKPSIADYFAHVRQVNLDAQANQEVPFEQLVDSLKIARSINHSPLFQIMLTTNTNFGLSDSGSEESTASALADLTLSPYQAPLVQAKFDLNIDLTMSDDGVGISWLYDVSLFSEQYISQLNEHLARLLTVLSEVSDGQGALDDLTVLSPEQVGQQLFEFNNTLMDYPQDECIHQLFEAQVKQNPHKIALEFKQTQLSYQALNQQANQLAHYLIEQQQIKPDALVGLCVERGPTMVIGMLGILKAGGAYVPLDPHYPDARLQYMCNDAALKVIVTDEQAQSVLTDFDARLVNIQDQTQFADYSVDNISTTAIKLDSSHLAYMIYTSGSTGQPKGVMIEHASTQAMLAWAEETYDDEALSRVLASTSVCFDLSVFEVFAPLTTGGCCVVVENALTLIERDVDVSLINTVPSAIKALMSENRLSEQVKTINLAGEPLPASIVNELLTQTSNRTVYNLYGPSEDTTYSTYMGFANQVDEVLIGKPINNSQAYVLDDKLSLLPVGCVGELYLGGAGLARGYFNRQQLTDERFIENPYYDMYNPNSSERLYRTGDLVRYTADGHLAFIGRADEQVKIRGFRIELGEIESHLNSDSEVDSALVMAQEVADSLQLVGYIKPQQSLEPEAQLSLVAKLKVALATQLPEHMVPNILMVIADWPLTPNGKIDKKALPAPDVDAVQGEFVAPQNDTQQTLVEIWSSLLRITPDNISISANFFALGGHSLLTIRLIAAIRARFDVELSVQQVFSAKTLADLAVMTEQHRGGEVRAPLSAIERTQEHYVVSFAQQRFWFIDKLQGGSPEYNMPIVFDITGRLDIALFNEVVTQIITRHEVLRTVFEQHNGEVRQRIRPMSEVDFAIQVTDLSEFSGQQQAQVLKQKVEAEIVQIFDLANDLMLRLSYFTTTSSTGVLVFNMHHIASDGWSLGIVKEEVFALYEALSTGKESTLSELDIQYVDYAQWQRDQLSVEELDKQFNYWQGQLADVPVVHSLPLSYTRPAHKQFVGAAQTERLSAAVSKNLQALAKRYQLTPFMLMHGALSLLLSRHSDQADIVVGTPVANRTQQELAPLVGCFVNTLVLRVDTNHATLADYFAHIKQVNLDAQTNQELPFEQLVDRLNLPRHTNITPLLQIFFAATATRSSENNQGAAASSADLTFALRQSELVQAKFDLSFDLAMDDDGVAIKVSYDVSLFSEQYIDELKTHLGRLFIALSELETRQTADEPMAPYQLAILSQAQQQHLISELNDTQADYPQQLCLHQFFEAQVEKNPNAVAVMFEDTQLSYQALNQQANQLAHYLIEKHQIKPDTMVGLCVERSTTMVVAMLGILKAGGAYVPLDPSYPQGRLQFMYSDASLSVVVGDSVTQSVLREFDGHVINLDSTDFADCSTGNISAEKISLDSSHLAYVIYTSGSTGQPKGVMIEHKSVTNFVTAMQDELAVSADDNVLGLTSINFDIHVLELFLTWQQGATLVLANQQQQRQPQQLIELIEQQQVSFAQMTPSTLTMLLQAQWKTDAQLTILSGGEALSEQSANLLRSYQPNSRLFNMYGPTETTVWSSMALLDQPTCHLGKAINNTQLFILDQYQQLLPFGSVGELYIGGAGLARGYLNQTTLTAERFIENPYFDPNNPNSSPRLYRTGDKVRYLPDGNLAFEGRVDEQVKVRGFRIEPGEIESQLIAQTGVESAVVLVKDLADGAQLVAYVKPQDLHVISASELKATLASQLPSHMVPNVLMVVDKWPLTPNGKLDRNALPEPDGSTLQGEYVAPKTMMEKELVNIFSEVLSIEADSISTQANFFELGGHSLLILPVIKMVEDRQKCQLPYIYIFENTLEQIASLLTDENEHLSDEAQCIAVKLNESTAKRKIFAVHAFGGGITCYNEIAKAVEDDVQLYGLIAPARVNIDVQYRCITELAQFYADEIRKVQPDGKYSLIGYSFGGQLAYYIGRILGDVEYILLIDSFFLEYTSTEFVDFALKRIEVLFELPKAHIQSEFVSLTGREITTESDVKQMVDHMIDQSNANSYDRSVYLALYNMFYNYFFAEYPKLRFVDDVYTHSVITGDVDNDGYLHNIAELAVNNTRVSQIDCRHDDILDDEFDKVSQILIEDFKVLDNR